jgi:hypothetical protein
VSADSTTRAGAETRFFHDAIRYDRAVIPFIVGLVVGASAAVLLMIVIGPSRRVRAEHPLPPDVEARILLGQDPDQPTIPPPPRNDDAPVNYSPNELAELRRIGEERRPRRRR